MCHFLVLSVTARTSAEQWWHHGPFSGLLCHRASFRSAMMTPWIIFWCFVSPRSLLQHNGDTMDHAFSGLLCHHNTLHSTMVTPWTIFWSFVSLQGIRQHDGETISHYLACCATARPSSALWWHLGPFSGLSCHCDTFHSTMVTTWTNLWSFVSPPGLPQHNGDTMDHFLVCFVTARPSAAWWWHHWAIYALLFHREAFPDMIATPWSNLWSFISPWGLPQHDCYTMDHFLVCCATARPSSALW